MQPEDPGAEFRPGAKQLNNKTRRTPATRAFELHQAMQSNFNTTFIAFVLLLSLPCVREGHNNVENGKG